MSHDPTGKRALFTSQTGQDQAADGKAALFSHADQPPGPVLIDCQRCGATTHVGAGDALRRVLGLSLWVPGKPYSRRLRCPACHRRAWVRLTLG
ncbi:MAG: hypothetical protein OEX04_09810 [Acidimicrobiia bacterium]|nr:hypothetical protein [Acidimicrobiia bacterium]MDH4307763.1 hypothetical protein [Acidimicrobiia bacterium]